MNSYDVWVYDPQEKVNIWLGYVNREHVEDTGDMWQAYRAREFGRTDSSVFGVVSLGEPQEDSEDAAQLIEDHFGTVNW